MASVQEKTGQVVQETAAEGLDPTKVTLDEDGAPQKPEELQKSITEDVLDTKQVEALETGKGVTSGAAVQLQHRSSPLHKPSPILPFAAHDSRSQLRTTSPLRSSSPLRRASPERTRKFFQEKVQEVVRRSRYGQWDFDFSPRSGRPSADEKCPPLTVAPWGPVPAKDIFSNILRPAYEDPDGKFMRQKSQTKDAHSLPTCPLPE
ncbi:hypothetical protein R1flu_016064 [Riccia fluitans]|uniref:Uncharacterized protein n=1 Tax=Riccia fluitans TaxID=41844 RepID=A0ABD1YKY2_9MARC